MRSTAVSGLSRRLEAQVTETFADYAEPCHPDCEVGLCRALPRPVRVCAAQSAYAVK